MMPISVTLAESTAYHGTAKTMYNFEACIMVATETTIAQQL